MKWVSRKSIALIVLLVLAVIAIGFFVFSSDGSEFVNGTPEQRRAAIHAAMTGSFSTAYYLHDAFLAAAEVGDQTTVPYLLKGLEKMPKGEPGKPLERLECTWAHGFDALRKITGHDGPYSLDHWKEWWSQNSSKTQDVSAEREEDR